MRTTRRQPQDFICRAVALGLALLPLLARSQAISYVDLHPPGAVESVALATTEQQQAGQMDDRATLWAGTPDSAVVLGGPNSFASDTTGTRQVGYYRTPPYHRGGFWSGTPDSWTLLPELDVGSIPTPAAFSIDGDQAVGWDFSFGGGAYLWDLSSGTVVDLKPPGVHGAAAFDNRGNQQVGEILDLRVGLIQAALWYGTAESFVNLHPAGALHSAAGATTGLLQGGYVRDSNFVTHAALWRGTADSFVDINPASAAWSQIRGAADDWQVGTARFQGVDHAGLWRGTAESFVDLHSALDASTYSDSQALGIWTAGRIIKIAGSATHTATGKSHAILWIVTLPDDEPPVIVNASANLPLLWPPNHNLTTINLAARVEDNAGEAEWRVVGIECNEVSASDDMLWVDGHTVTLRATRSGRGVGRVYTVWLQAEDAAGNVSKPYPVHVTMPHDQRQKSK